MLSLLEQHSTYFCYSTIPPTFATQHSTYFASAFVQD